jgi:peptidoglycan/xylan/chitin deacetylase (PgdA/CDA1 family)
MSARQFAKQFVKTACVRSGALLVAHRLTASSAVILRYHSVHDHPEKFATTIGCDSIHAASIFTWQMELLARRFNPVSMDDVLLFLKGTKSLPPRAVVVTLDDGYKDNFQIAAPILNRVGIPATFYVLVDSVDRSRAPWYCRLRQIFLTSRGGSWKDPTTGKVHKITNPSDRDAAFLAAVEFCAKAGVSEREQYVLDAESSLDPEVFPAESELMMTWDDVRSLVKSGHNVGAHTMTHPNLAHISADEVRTELADAKRKLESELGRTVLHFSYPSPALSPIWNMSTLKLTAEVGYSTAVTTMCSAVWNDTNALALPRTYIPRDKPEFLWNTERTFLKHSHSATIH